MKKIINKPSNLLEDILKGIEYAYLEYLRKIDEANVLIRSNKSSDKVTPVSGSGSVVMKQHMVVI
jgi:phosphoenolpyruvate---glycerone phosphotransferase subunit DhaK